MPRCIVQHADLGGPLAPVKYKGSQNNDVSWMVWELWPNVKVFTMFTGAWNVRSSMKLNISHDRAHQYASSYQEWMMLVEWFGSYDQMSKFFQCSLEREMFGQAWNWTCHMIELINMHHRTKNEKVNYLEYSSSWGRCHI